MNDTIIVSEKDYLRLKSALEAEKSTNIENLEIELERAKIVSDEEVPPDLVTMNSKIRFLDLSLNRERTVTITYPLRSNIDEGSVSILAPLGSALIGLRVNQEINWMFPNGKTRRLKVLEVIYQPEANGDWHL